MLALAAWSGGAGCFYIFRIILIVSDRGRQVGFLISG
jgi:hypothetical protein